MLFSYLYRRSLITYAEDDLHRPQCFLSWQSMHMRFLTPSLTYFLTAPVSRRLRQVRDLYSTLVAFDFTSTALDFQSLALRNALRILPGRSVDLVSKSSSPLLFRCPTLSLDFGLSNFKSWHWSPFFTSFAASSHPSLPFNRYASRLMPLPRVAQPLIN